MEVRLLGPLEARRNGVPVHINARMNRALLAILVVSRGEVVPAGRIADLLWGDAPPPKATAALHTKVAHLRRALQPERVPRSEDSVIRTSPAGYRIAREDVDLDADRFERLVERARPLLDADPRGAAALLDEALGLWRGPALVEFADEPFAVATVQRLESLRLTAVELRAEAALGLGDAARAVDQLTPHVAAHPLREQARASLARALYRAGRQADALAALAEGRRLLRDELGLDPGPELQRLEARILAHDPGLAPAPPTPAARPARPVPPPATSTLVGRETETALLTAAVGDAAARAGSVVLVTGDAGMGKSALLGALAATVRSAGGTVRSATCRDGSAAPPFWPVLQMVREAAAEAGPAERQRLAEALGPLADVLPDRGGRAAAGGVDPAMVLVHLADALALALGRTAPALVVLDDLHAADPATLRLVAALAAEVGGTPTVLALGLRTGEGGDSPALVDTLAALGRAPRLVRLDLDPLPPEAVAALVRGALADPAAADVAELVDRAGGNPFFALELARAAGAGDPLTPGRGRPVGGVPAPVYDVLRQRFLRLPPAGLDLLTAAAVAGGPLPADDLAAVAGVPADEALDLLDTALGARLLADAGDGRYAVAHALVGEALRASLSSARLARLHRAVAEQLSAGAGPQEAARIASHHLAARALDGGAAALPWLERASDAAVRVSALEAVRELNEQVLTVVGPADGRRELRARSRIAFADVWSGGYDVPSTREYSRLVRAWEVPRPPEPDDLELLWVATMLQGQMGRLDDADATVARMAELAAAVEDDTARYLYRDMAAVVRWRQSRFAEALEHLDVAEALVAGGRVDLGRSLASSPPTRIALVRALCLWHLGRREEAFAQADAALAAAGTAGLGAPGFARRWALVLALMDGDPERVRRLVDLRLGEQSWERFRYPSAVVRFAEEWLRAREDPAAGLAGMRAAHAELVDHGLAGGRSVLLGLLADVALRAGEPAQALAFCDAGLAVAGLAESYWVPALERLRETAQRAASAASAGPATVAP